MSQRRCWKQLQFLVCGRTSEFAIRRSHSVTYGHSRSRSGGQRPRYANAFLD
ncbi:hypothetical protein [Moorena sp. SIO4G3]|uniref:hypothetical protein n=1 Tax=Moorena sp. SIO4G3 TaxID=2607821 RepID=UPI0025EF94D3|nr:hypothetical protein [Moorena sp. SIO4G3]